MPFGLSGAHDRSDGVLCDDGVEEDLSLAALLGLSRSARLEAMRSRWPILALLCVLASLLVPGTASANSSSGVEIRFWTFGPQEQIRTGGASALTPELRPGYELSYDDQTSGSPLAARGGGITASNGTEITGYAKHGLDRVIGDGGKRAGVKPSSILDTLKNPKSIKSGVDSKGRPF